MAVDRGGLAANYWPGANLYGLIPPPAWWLEELKRFDDQLVLFPSQRLQGVYILARRARRSSGEKLHDARDPGTGRLVPQNPDTLFMHTHKLVRVCAIAPGVLWDMRVFHKLAAHDIWRLGGATVVADRLDAMDDTRHAALDKAQQDEIDARSRAAYAGYKHRIGERLYLGNKHGRGTLKKTPVSVHVRKPSNPPDPPRVVLA